MTFDNIVIGGGLSGLVAAIGSQRAGRRTAIVSAGQSALHFWSGSFEFLSRMGESDVIEDPLAAARTLPESHPYRRLGLDRTERLLGGVAPLMAEAGIRVHGSLRRNHLRLTPTGMLRPAWMSLADYFTLDSPANVRGCRYAIVNIAGYIDFYPRFLEHGLRKLGADCFTAQVDIPQLAVLRRSTTEMRATNISRFMSDDAVDTLARKVEEVSAGADAVIMPAVLGIFSDSPVERLRAALSRPVHFIATTPASVPGVRCQLALRDLFTRLGGTFVPGDTVKRGDFKADRLERIYTRNFGDMSLEAENFVIATGSFFGQGLIATIDRIHEPVFGLDVEASACRSDWYDKNFYHPQPYMTYGVRTDETFRPSREGRTIRNLYATGSLLSGPDTLTEGSGAGITLATALHAAEQITSNSSAL